MTSRPVSFFTTRGKKTNTATPSATMIAPATGCAAPGLRSTPGLSPFQASSPPNSTSMLEAV